MTPSTIDNNQPLVVCLHASASSSRQWSALIEQIESRVRCIAPDLVGYNAGDAVPRGQRFHFDHEIDNVLTQIRDQTGKTNGPLHLVGHSYGGAVALQLALAHPCRVASITVYEPAQFLMLFEDGLRSPQAREILALWRYAKARTGTMTGRFKAARRFIEYWSGEGAWQYVSLKRRCRFARLMPKVVAEFEAILSSGVKAETFAKLDIPVRIICGTRTRATAELTARRLAAALPNVEFVSAEGADHMGPTNRPNAINPLIAEHLCQSLRRRVAAAA